MQHDLAILLDTAVSWCHILQHMAQSDHVIKHGRAMSSNTQHGLDVLLSIVMLTFAHVRVMTSRTGHGLAVLTNTTMSWLYRSFIASKGNTTWSCCLTQPCHGRVIPFSLYEQSSNNLHIGKYPPLRRKRAFKDNTS